MLMKHFLFCLSSEYCLKVSFCSTQEKYRLSGSGNEAQCRANTRKLLQAFNHTDGQCPFQNAECSLQAIKTKLGGAVPNGKFLATGGLYYTTNELSTVSGNAFAQSPFDPDGYQKGTVL